MLRKYACVCKKLIRQYGFDEKKEIHRLVKWSSDQEANTVIYRYSF